jgi:hypothetical protein
MRKDSFGIALALLLLVVWAAPASPAEPGASRAPATDGFVPVAIWELQREGFPTVKHAWVAGSDKMLRISWDDGATWFGFKPVFSDTARGMLAISVMAREEIGRGEVDWREKVRLTIVADHDGRVSLPFTASAPTLDVTLKLLEIREVSPSELKCDTKVDSAAADPGGTPMASGGGGGRSCCVSCQGVLVCDCSVCIEACHASCCVGGCFCQPC